MKQKAFMSWDRIVRSWRQLKDGIVFQCCRLADDMGTQIDLIGAEMSSDGQSGDAQTTAFRPDDRGRRSEFHCILAANLTANLRGESKW